MRRPLLTLLILAGSMTLAPAQVSLQIGTPNLSLGISLGSYPRMVAVPGYPVYYAPGVDANFFFYDGLYWVFQGDSWYAASWYNGPWGLVAPEAVPPFLLRVPVRYYRRPPAFFRGWQADAPPRWGEHWGPAWQQKRAGWDQWDRRSAPAPAQLPSYQRNYQGPRYPSPQQQSVLHQRNYHYQPKEPLVQQHYQRLRRPPEP